MNEIIYLVVGIFIGGLISLIFKRKEVVNVRILKEFNHESPINKDKRIKYRIMDGEVEFQFNDYWYCGSISVWHHANGVGRAKCEYQLSEYYEAYNRLKGTSKFNEIFMEIQCHVS